jgi:site-specific recombinase XerD
VHYASDVRIFFKWVNGRTPESITVHDVDEFIEWQQSLGRVPATIRRRLIALRFWTIGSDNLIEDGQMTEVDGTTGVVRHLD